MSGRTHGRILSDGTVVPDESRNLTDANVSWSAAEPGLYCFQDLPFEAVNAVATSAFANLAQPVVRTGSGSGVCPVNTSLRVEMRHDTSGNLNTPFRIVIYAG